MTQPLEVTTTRGGYALPTQADLDKLMSRFRGRDEELIDRFTLREIELVLRRALYGWTFSELHGYLGYRKRHARGEDKVKARRIIKALRTDLWGLRGAVVEAYKAGESDARTKAKYRGADRLHQESIRDIEDHMPANKRKSQDATGKAKPDIRRALPDPEADAQAEARHNRKVFVQSIVRRVAASANGEGEKPTTLRVTPLDLEKLRLCAYDTFHAEKLEGDPGEENFMGLQVIADPECDVPKVE